MASYLSSGYPPRPLAVLQSIAANSAFVPVMGRVVSVDTRCADLLSVSVGTRANLPLFEPSLSLDNVVSSASNSDEGLGLGSRTPVVGMTVPSNCERSVSHIHWSHVPQMDVKSVRSKAIRLL